MTHAAAAQSYRPSSQILADQRPSIPITGQERPAQIPTDEAQELQTPRRENRWHRAKRYGRRNRGTNLAGPAVRGGAD